MPDALGKPDWTLRRRAARVPAAAVAVIALVLVQAPPASATTFSSEEVVGNSAAARGAATALRDPWAAQLAAQGIPVPDPIPLTGSAGAPLSGEVYTTPDGTTVTLVRSRYTPGASTPTFVELSPNPGTLECTNGGRSMQGSSPRPSILIGDATCSGPEGFVYAESGGPGESTTRDAIEFVFSQPIAAAGAWFGDLATRTDGLGVPAIVRAYNADGTIAQEAVIVPSGDQSTCAGAQPGCGNTATRWIGITAGIGDRITRVSVIVGDATVGGTGGGEGMGFVGPSVVSAAPTLSIAASAPVGPYSAGQSVPVTLTISNTGAVDLMAVTSVSAGLADFVCAAADIAVGETTACTGTHVATQEELDAGSFPVTATADGEWWGIPAPQGIVATSLPIEAAPVEPPGPPDPADPPDPPDPREPTGELAESGAEPIEPGLAAASALVIVGVALLCRRRAGRERAGRLRR